MLEFYIKRGNVVIATGHFKDEDWDSKTFILHKGSSITPLKDRLKNIYKGSWQKLKELSFNGSIKNNILTKDIEFRSTSEAGMFVIGIECQGPEMFKDKNGKSINEYLEDKKIKQIFVNDIDLNIKNINTVKLPVSIFSLDKILNDRIVVKSKINEENIDTTDAYIAKDFDELLRTTGKFININYTSLNIGEKLIESLPKEIWENPEIYKMRFLDISGDSGFLERYLIKKLISNKYMKQQFPDYGQRVFHILHNMIYAIAKTNATSLWLRKAVYYSADTRIIGYRTEGNRRIDTGDYPTIFNGNLFSRGKDTNKLDSYKINGNIKSPYIEDLVGEDQIFNYPLFDWVNSGKDILEYISVVFWDLFTDEKYTANPDEKQKERQGEIMEEIKKTLNGYFDVIMGNPPYNTNNPITGNVEKTIYQLFCRAAEELNPKYTSFIIPSKWMYGKANGKDMTEFVQNTLTGNKLIYLELIGGKTAFPTVSPGEISIYTKNLKRDITSSELTFNNYGEISEYKDLSKITYVDSKGKTWFQEEDTILTKIRNKNIKNNNFSWISEDTKVIQLKSGITYDNFGHDLFEDAVGFKFTDKKIKPLNWKEGDQEVDRPTLDYSLVKNTIYDTKFFITDVSLHKKDSKGNYERPIKNKEDRLPHIWISSSIISDYNGNDFNHPVLVTTQNTGYSTFKLSYPYNAFIIKPGEITSARLYAIGRSLQTEKEVLNLQKFIKSDLATYLIAKKAISPKFDPQILGFLPYLDFNKEWNDSELYNLFELDEEEVKRIKDFRNKFTIPKSGEDNE
jgi:hypothetical protein